MNEFLIALSGLILAVGTYLVWPSRFNIIAHTRLGLTITAFVIPVYLTDVLKKFDQGLVLQYALMGCIGAAFYVLGLFGGFHLKIQLKNNLTKIVSRFNLDAVKNFVIQISPALTILGILLIALSFLGMGFIPAFSDDPFAARFFRGDYKEAYQPFALPYRMGYQIVILFSAVNLALYAITRRKLFIVLAFLCSVTLLLTLNRSPTSYAIILFLGCLASCYKRWFWPYILFVVLIYPLGSMSYLLIGSVFNLDQFSQNYDASNIWTSIASGAPDVPDQLNFLYYFQLLGSEWTNGQTFFGGLIPYNSFWNPAVYSLYIVNNGLIDVDKIVSGGLRVGLPLWGYVSFSWVGVACLSLFSGFIWGICTKVMCSFIIQVRSKNHDFMHKAGLILLGLLVYDTMFRFIAEFYTTTLYNVATVFLLLFLLYGNRIVQSALNRQVKGL